MLIRTSSSGIRVAWANSLHAVAAAAQVPADSSGGAQRAAVTARRFPWSVGVRMGPRGRERPLRRKFFQLPHYYFFFPAHFASVGPQAIAAPK